MLFMFLMNEMEEKNANLGPLHLEAWNTCLNIEMYNQILHAHNVDAKSAWKLDRFLLVLNKKDTFSSGTEPLTILSVFSRHHFYFPSKKLAGMVSINIGPVGLQKLKFRPLAGIICVNTLVYRNYICFKKCTCIHVL
jgi:hypothetical protein